MLILQKNSKLIFRNQGSQNTFDSILIVITRMIGDVLITTPLIHQARVLWPNARIDVLGFQGTLNILYGNPDINNLIEVVPGSGLRQSWSFFTKLWRRYDLALIAEYSDRAHLYGWAAASKRVGLVPSARKAWWKHLITDGVTPLSDPPLHILLEKLNLLSPWTSLPAVISLQPPPGVIALPANIVALSQHDYVVLQVPSLVRYKQWSAQNYASVAKQLAKQGYQIFLTGGSSAGDRATAAEVHRLANASSVFDLSGQLDLQQMVTLLTDAKLYIGPDTSITHLAAACGTPTIALYGPIDPRLWGPWPACWPSTQPYAAHAERQKCHNVILLQGSPACVPCNKAGCDNHRESRSECLETIEPGRVLYEALAILERAEL